MACRPWAPGEQGAARRAVVGVTVLAPYAQQPSTVVRMPRSRVGITLTGTRPLQAHCAAPSLVCYTPAGARATGSSFHRDASPGRAAPLYMGHVEHDDPAMLRLMNQPMDDGGGAEDMAQRGHGAG